MDDPEQPNKNKDLISYSAQRAFLATMVAHFAVFLFTSFIVYTVYYSSVSGPGKYYVSEVVSLVSK